jgi:GNAT superfamily N-acetyltransferase
VTLFTLRPAQAADKALIDAYTYNEGMDNIPDLQGVTVAVNVDDAPVGFIRIVHDSCGVAHINPVVTYAPWRGYGVGRALVEAARAQHGELRLVSRGSSVGFYEALGFEPCAWDLIEPGVSEDCEGCELKTECRPLPMRKL